MRNEWVQRKADGTIWRAGHHIWGLCAAWNHATRPYIPLTESDHNRSAVYARACTNRMIRQGYVYSVHFTEFSNGMRWPLSELSTPVYPGLSSYKPDNHAR